MASEVSLQTFYTAQLSAATVSLALIEDYLFTEDVSSATSLMSSFSEATQIQTNYKTFYGLYKKYISSSLNSTDKTDLNNLAHLCPFKDGTVIYQARALNDLVTGLVEIYNDQDCDAYPPSDLTYGGEEEFRKISIAQAGMDYALFPNPATDKLYITSIEEKELIELEIKDVTNKLILKGKIEIKNHQAELKLDLINGIYFVSLIRPNENSITKKIVISK